MSEFASNEGELRVLLLAPTNKDAALTQATLRRAGIESELPFSELASRPGVAGSGLYSRHTLQASPTARTAVGRPIRSASWA